MPRLLNDKLTYTKAEIDLLKNLNVSAESYGFRKVMGGLTKIA